MPLNKETNQHQVDFGYKQLIFVSYPECVDSAWSPKLSSDELFQ